MTILILCSLTHTWYDTMWYVNVSTLFSWFNHHNTINVWNSNVKLLCCRRFNIGRIYNKGTCERTYNIIISKLKWNVIEFANVFKCFSRTSILHEYNNNKTILNNAWSFPIAALITILAFSKWFVIRRLAGQLIFCEGIVNARGRQFDTYPTPGVSL